MLDGAKVQRRRKALGLKQKELAALVSITACSVSKIEGRGMAITLALALRLAWALRCNVGELV